MIEKIINYISKNLNVLYCYLLYGGLGIILNSWNRLRCGKILHRNFGDELNYYLLKELTGKPISNYVDLPRWATAGKTNYLFIGSLVEDFATENTVIWGSGAIVGAPKSLLHKPKEVRAVRGKLTRKYLLENDVFCPEVYGDPALLTPLVYQPQIEKRYEWGIIPHVDDLESLVVKYVIAQGVKVIHLDNYIDWHDVIDEICSCKRIMSSSLHGLILSDAYHIPNVWITLGGNLLGGTFKFQDYFSSVNRIEDTPFVLTEGTVIAECEEIAVKYKPIDYDPQPLIDAAPWKLNLKYQK